MNEPLGVVTMCLQYKCGLARIRVDEIMFAEIVALSKGMIIGAKAESEQNTKICRMDAFGRPFYVDVGWKSGLVAIYAEDTSEGG